MPIKKNAKTKTILKPNIYKRNTKVIKEKEKKEDKSITDVNKKSKKVSNDKNNTKVNEIKAEKANKSNIKVNEPSTEILVYKDNIKVNTKIQNDLLEIAGLKNKINEMLSWYETKHKNVVEIPELKLSQKHFTGKITVKSFRIYTDIIKKFEIFANKHSQYKTQDLVSQALLELIEKYR
ncbi:MAG: hypothetical protein PHR57_02890 [Patescibacteria group bacterium]|jgi:hypothetical protein|nr:hypothetical protein [Patescibacteria group bacterium]